MLQYYWDNPISEILRHYHDIFKIPLIFVIVVLHVKSCNISRLVQRKLCPAHVELGVSCHLYLSGKFLFASINFSSKAV